MKVSCPLCRSSVGGTFFTRDDPRHGVRRYHRCGTCALVFLDPVLRLAPPDERARYANHRNHPDDPGYVAFLSRLADPLCSRLMPGWCGLDFGCGPGPTLSRMLQRRGFPTADYDPYFFPHAALLDQTYHFITASEVVEHLYDPRDTLVRLDGLLRPGGMLGVMTEVLDCPKRFPGWWYHRDPTHVCFYAPETLDWITRWRGWALERPHRNVALFIKPAARP